MNWLLVLLMCGASVSCTTVANRRDLYSPEPAPDSREGQRQLSGELSKPAQPGKSPAPEDTAPHPDFR